MITDDIIFTLKDGREAFLRCPTEADIEGTIDYLNKSAGESDFVMRTPEECGQYTYEGEKSFFEYLNASPNDLMLVCIVGGKVAGNCHISFYDKLKTRHRGTVAIALLKEFWNLGIGTRMFGEMIKAARDKGCVTQLELEFIEGNTRARALYEKMGFRITGVKPNAIKQPDGSMLNLYMMVKEL